MEVPLPPAPDLDKHEAGFALLTVLFVLIGVTAIASAGFILADSDYRVSQNHRSSVHAFLAANGGLYEYVGDQKKPDVKRTYAYTTGDADVGPQQLLDLGDGRSLYRITSQATYDAPEGGTATHERLDDGDPRDRRLQRHGPARVPHDASTRTAARARSMARTGRTTATATAPRRPRSPASPCRPAAMTRDGGSPVPEGDPDILEDDIAGLLALIGLDWAGVINGDVVTSDYTIPSDSWPSIGADEWPVIHATGDISLAPGNSGQRHADRGR